MAGWQIPTLADVLDAKRQIARYLDPTPLYRYPRLNALAGGELLVKHENHQPVGAFKVRGGINLISRLDAQERKHGVIAASTGNHGQSVAYAARLFGVRATVCVPRDANPVKVAAMRSLGAEIVSSGRSFDQACEQAERLALEAGYRYINSGNEPLLIAGVATETLEIIEHEPQIDVIIIPVGGGSGAAGACIVAKAIRPSIQVIGVQSEAAPAAFRSWQEHRPVSVEPQTFAEGIATGIPFELPQLIMRKLLDDFVLVSDQQIRDAQAMLIDTTCNLVEAAGAATLAAALKLRERLRSKRVALIASGGNVTRTQLAEVLETGAATS